MGERYLAQLNARQSIRRGVYKNLYKQRVNYGGRKYVVEVKKYSGFFDWFIHLFDSRVSNTFTDKEKSKLKLQVMHKPVENFTENDKKRLKQKKARVYSKLKRLFKGYKVGGSKVSSKMVEETYWPETFEITFNSNKHHIYLTALQPYFKEWKNSSDIDEDFVSWMEKKFKKLDENEKQNILSNSVKYLSAQERRDYAVGFNEQGQVTQQGNILEDGSYIFALGMTENSQGNAIPMLCLGKKQRGKFQHSSFFQGGAIQSAGMFKIVDGKIKSVKNHSGHYLPRAEHIETLKGYLTDNLSLEDLAKIEWKILSDKVMNVVSSLQKIPFAYKIYQWFK